MPQIEVRRDGIFAEFLVFSFIILGLSGAVVFLLVASGPSPELASILHGSQFGLLFLLLVLAGGLRGRRRFALVTGVVVAFLYLLTTSISFLSIDVLPYLPTEHWIADLGDELVTAGADGDSAEGQQRVTHWSVGPLGHWGRYERPGVRAVLLSPQRVAFQRIGHDAAAILLGLIAAALVGILLEERPGTYDTEMLPANEGRGSPDALRELIARSRGGGRGGQAPSTRA